MRSDELKVTSDVRERGRSQEAEVRMRKLRAQAGGTIQGNGEQ